MADLAELQAAIAELQAANVALAMRVLGEEMTLAEIAALEHRPIRQAQPQREEVREPSPAGADLPAFMRHMSARPVPATVQSSQSPDVGDAIAAVNEIESRAMSAIDRLEFRISSIEARLDIKAPPPAPDESSAEAIRTLETWLRSIEERSAHADQVAAATAVEQERLKELVQSQQASAPATAVEPQMPVDPVLSAVERIKTVGRARRDAVIGKTADDRDVRLRLTEVGLNAGTGHAKSVEMLKRLASGSSMSPDEMRRALVEGHDAATGVAVATVAAEAKWISLVMADGGPGISSIVERAVAEIEAAGA